MSVTISKEVVEQLKVQHVDGANPGNVPKVLDAGDVIVQQRWSFIPDKRETVTDADVLSYGSLARFFKNFTGNKVDIFSDNAGELKYLVYRSDKKLGGTKVINGYGRDLAEFPGEVSADTVQKEIEDAAGRCPETQADPEAQEKCVKSQVDFVKSAVTYTQIHQVFQEKHAIFFGDSSLTSEDVGTFVESAEAYALAYKVYLEYRQVFKSGIQANTLETPI